MNSIAGAAFYESGSAFNLLRPMNVAVAPGSTAEKTIHTHTGLPGTRVSVFSENSQTIPLSPAHDLVYYGGKTIPDLSYFNFYLGGSRAWHENDIQNIDLALEAAMSDAYLNNVLLQYFDNRVISSTFKGSQVLPEPQPALFSQGDVEQLLSRFYSEGIIEGHDLSMTVFNLMLPRGTVLNNSPDGTGHVQGAPDNQQLQDEMVDSLHGLCGYHGSVHLRDKAGATITLYYTVGVFSESMKGRTNGVTVFDQPWKNVVATFYHLLNEVRTDPDVSDAIRAGDTPEALKFLGWVSRRGEECGDMILSNDQLPGGVYREVELTDGGGSVPVQLLFSNAIHAPEGPLARPHHLNR
ncbi:MAG TPA: hypothetical protein VH186_19495 [Chloroflexia bacterium]|nr:hypothetical protein [Chloroflexia bacterium]